MKLPALSYLTAILSIKLACNRWLFVHLFQKHTVNSIIIASFPCNRTTSGTDEWNRDAEDS